jgi:TolB-like protein
MSTMALPEPDTLFSVSAVEEALEKIFRDPHFSESAVLRKFLSFIVQETILGRSNCLKEYTIAINVLEKPTNFNPQQNAIVRIHAGRLRRALKRYYQEMGRNDQIVITIPKGKYLPFFANRRNLRDIAIIEQEQQDISYSSEYERSIILAILPFDCPGESVDTHSFRERLCLQMNSMLACLDDVTMVSYQALRSLTQTYTDYEALTASYGIDYIITGSTQIVKGKMRVSIQMVESEFYRLLWSQTFERKLTRSNVFEVQDEIATYVMSQVEEFRNKKNDSHEAVLTSYV